MQQLGLLDGDAVLLHVKVIRGQWPEAARPWRPFGFFVNVVTSEGRAFFRPKVLPDDDVGRLVDEVLSRVRSSPGEARGNLARAKLSHHGKPLKRGQTVSWHGIREGDELVLHLDGVEGDPLPAEQPPAESKRTASLSSAAAAPAAATVRRRVPPRGRRMPAVSSRPAAPPAHGHP